MLSLQRTRNLHVDLSAVLDRNDRESPFDDGAFISQIEIIDRAKVDLRTAGQLPVPPRPIEPRQEKRSEHGPFESRQPPNSRAVSKPGVAARRHKRGPQTRSPRRPVHSIPSITESPLSSLQSSSKNQLRGPSGWPVHSTSGGGIFSRDNGQLQRFIPSPSRSGTIHGPTGRRHIG